MSDYKKILGIAGEIDKELRSDDPRLCYSVYIEHEDGARLWFDYAYILLYYDPQHDDWGSAAHVGEWIFVFTEHHGYHVYPKDDIRHYAMYERKQEFKHPDYPDDQWVCDTCYATFIEPSKVKEGIACSECFGDNIRKLTDEEKEEINHS